MNSSEQKDYQQVTPTEQEVDETLAEIKQILRRSEPGSLQHEGLTEVSSILQGKETEYEQIGQHLASDTSRAMAVLAVDYLNGACKKETLLDFLNR